MTKKKIKRDFKKVKRLIKSSAGKKVNKIKELVKKTFGGRKPSKKNKESKIKKLIKLAKLKLKLKSKKISLVYYF